MNMFFFILICITLNYIFTLSPSKLITPIKSTVSNAEQYSNYTFTFSHKLALPKNSLVEIKFPSQYLPTLGIEIVSSSSCSVPCKISSHLVSLTLLNGLNSNSELSLSINFVMNPVSSGGTGNFQIKTRYNDYYFEINLIFGVIGIAIAPRRLAGCALNAVNKEAGSISIYNLAFKVIGTIDSNSFIIFSIPPNSLFSFPDDLECSSYAINGYKLDDLKCEKIITTNQIKFFGLTKEIPANSEIGILFKLKNPPFSLTTQNFALQIFKYNTNCVTDSRMDISGIVISPGKLSNIIMKPQDPFSLLTMGKTMVYELSFKIKNQLDGGGAIDILFPLGFEIIYGTSFDYVRPKCGLKDLDNTHPLLIDFDKDYITIKNYAPMPSEQLIILEILTINPNANGVTKPIIITTYKIFSSFGAFENIIVDMDLTATKVTIQNYPASILTIPLGISSSNTLSNGNSNDLTISMPVSIAVPLGGIIIIKLPKNFTIDAIATTDCFSNIGVTNAAACEKSTDLNQIKVTLAGSVGYSVGASNYLQIKNKIKNPTINGTYFIEISTYQTDGITLIESFSDFITLSGLINIVVYSGKLYGNSASSPSEPVYSIFVLKFTLTKDLPASPQTVEDNINQGLVILSIPSNWDYDLGTGLIDNSYIPCEGIGEALLNVFCKLRIGSLLNPIKIEIRGFNEMVIGNVFEVHILKIKNPLIAGSTNFDIFILNRHFRILNLMNFITIPVTIYALVVSTTFASTVYTSSSSLVSAELTLTYNLKFLTTINANDLIILQLPSYDSGYFSSSSTLICKINSVIYVCKGYSSVQWILITVTATYTAVSNPVVVLDGLKWPRTVYAMPEGILGRILASSTLKDTEIRHLSVGFVPAIETYTISKVNSNKNRYNDIDCTYTFTFNANNDIFSGCEILISFPTNYNLLSDPSIRFVQPLTTSPFLNAKLQIINFQQIKITNFVSLPKTVDFSFSVTGIKNPPNPIINSWTIEAIYKGNSLNKKIGFTIDFTLSKLFYPFLIKMFGINLSPNNNKLIADYCFDFDINYDYDIPVGSDIEIKFPTANYPIMPSSPSFNVSGAINYIDSLDFFGNIYFLKTASLMIKGSQRLKICFKKILNPEFVSKTETFQIKVRYDGVYISNTDNSIIYNVIFTDTPLHFTINEFIFDPNNEGEKGFYSLKLTLDIALTSSNAIYVIFPDLFDEGLVQNFISCNGVKNINSVISCSFLPRILIISDITHTEPLQPIEIEIFGIVNPNSISNSNTGYVKIGIIDQNTPNRYMYFYDKAGLFTLTSAPGYCLINSIIPDNNYVRYAVNYIFNLTFYQTVPNKLAMGNIFIFFPDEYDLPMGNFPCSLINSNAILTCQSVLHNAIFIQSSDGFSGTLLLLIESVTNPSFVGSTGDFFLMTFDGYNLKTLERSYSNISPMKISFDIKGFSATVNDYKIINVIAGTQSELIPLTLENPSYLNLTFKAYSTGFSVIPSSVNINVGFKLGVFRISVSKDVSAGFYYFLWETINDPNLMYNIIKKNQIKVITDTKSIVTISPIFDIPISGISIPIYFKTSNPPDSSFQIDISFDNNTLLFAYPKTLIFESGTTILQTRFYSRNVSIAGPTSVEAIFLISGINKQSYALEKNSVKFNLIALDTVKPILSQFKIDQTTRTTATFSLSSNEPCVAYYVRSLAGSQIPIFSEAVNGGPAFSLTTESKYGSINLATTSTLNFIDLKAGMNYTITVYIVDQADNYDGPQTIVFQTMANYRAAEFSIRVNKAFLTSNEKLWLRKNIAFVMALNETNVNDRILDLSNLPGESSSNDQSIIYFYMNFDVTNTLLDSPLIVASTLQTKLIDLKSYYPIVDVSYTIKTAETVYYEANFAFQPNFTTITENSVTLNISLSNFGIVYALLIDYESDLLDRNAHQKAIIGENYTQINGTLDIYKPTSKQIFKGLSRENFKFHIVDKSILINKKNENFTLEFKDLLSNHSYYIYITSGNVYPEPDLLDSSKIVGLNFTTLVKIEIEAQSAMLKLFVRISFFFIIFISVII